VGGAERMYLRVEVELHEVAGFGDDVAGGESERAVGAADVDDVCGDHAGS
jgi:hypothetical protein